MLPGKDWGGSLGRDPGAAGIMLPEGILISRIAPHRIRRATQALCAAMLLSCGPSAAGALAAGVPVAQNVPTVSGQVVVGDTLHATRASWSASPTSYEDWWLRCDRTGMQCLTVIPGAYGLDYTLTSADVGHRIEFGEFASNASGDGKPVYSATTAEILATPPRRFTLVGPTGTPQFAYYLVENGPRRPTARDWRTPDGQTTTVGEVDADVSPGQTIYFSPTTEVGVRWGGIRHMLEPEGPSGKPFHVTARTPQHVRVVLPSPGRAYHPKLSRAELWVLGQLNRKRRRIGSPPLRVSTILDKVASVGARDEAVHGRWPDPYFFTLAPAFGWPGDLTQSGLTVIDAPLSRPSEVLAHWDGAYTGESTGLWDEIRLPFMSYVGIADGGGAWNIVLVASCPAQVDPVKACGLTNITGT
jgi:hypothetical protein